MAMLRFHLDENVDHAIAVGLRSRGIEATRTEDVGMKGADDQQQLMFSLREMRVIVSHDDDLLVLHSQGVAHGGIAFSTLRTRSIGQIILKLVALSRRFDPPDMMGRVEFL
jgi:predicted nuclease of predicted toxin-antitoxin system